MKQYRDVRVSGGDPLDVIYSHSTEGTFNVSKALHMIKTQEEELGITRARFPLTQSIREANANADVSEIVQAQLTAQTAREPVLLLMLPDETVICIDGNNRLRWLIDHGFEEGLAYVLPITMIEMLRVKMEGLRSDGIWEPIMETEEELKETFGMHDPRSATRRA